MYLGLVLVEIQGSFAILNVSHTNHSRKKKTNYKALVSADEEKFAFVFQFS